MDIFKQEIIEQLSKRASLSVAVPDKCFHADDVFCMALLRRLARECGFSLKVYRTKDPCFLGGVDMRIAVGGIYSEKTLDFDYHQNDPLMFQPEGIRHAAIGLLCQWCMTPEFLLPFREKYLLGLEYQTNNGRPHPKYSSIGFFVPAMLPAYGEEKDLDEAFEQTVQIAEVILDRCLKTTEGMLKAEEEFFSVLQEEIAGGQIVVLRKRIPIILSLHRNLAFTILKTATGYSVVALNDHSLKRSLRGLSGDRIRQACGHSGVFIHKGGVTAVMDTLEGAKEICVRSL